MHTAKWVRVSFLVLLALGLATPAIAQLRPIILNDSEAPGSVLVFPKILPGQDTDANAPRTEIEISVVCPSFPTAPGTPLFACPEQWPPSPGRRIKLLAHWVCPGSQRFEDKFICRETDFVLQTTINGTIRLDANGNVSPPQATATASGRIPTPPRECDNGGYLIVWVVNELDLPIKFDGLIGNAVLREMGGASAYNAVPIQSGVQLAAAPPGALTEPVVNNQALDFNGGEYQALSGKIFGTVRFDNFDGAPPFAATALTLLTLDVRSNAPNNPTSVNLNFYNEREELLSTSVDFVCWTQVLLNDINANLSEAGMGSRKGLFESGLAQKFPIIGIPDGVGPVTLIGLIENVETSNGRVFRETAFSAYHDRTTPVLTTFFPAIVPALP